VSPNIDKHLQSILVNDDFINYILNPNLILNEMWENHFNIHPEDISFVNDARHILHGESDPTELSAEEAFSLEKSIFEKCSLTFN